jgi:uncharacterized repeat protein (TIGR01451 family)
LFQADLLLVKFLPMPDNINQPNVTSEVPLEPAPEVISVSPVLPSQPSTPNSPTQPTPPVPPTPPPPLPKSEILTPDIAPKKPSKTKIILTSIIGLFLLGAVAGAVVLVRQNQDIRKYAAEGDSCEYGQTCTAGEHSGTQSCSGTIQGGTCKYDPNVNPNCSACGYCGDGNCGGGEGADNCPQDCGGGNPRTASQVCTDEGGSATSACTADPSCSSKGGACCDKSGVNNCCYGDSASRKDGACYAGGASGVSCSGTTITNNTGQSVTIRHFTKNPATNNYTCPLTAAGGGDTTLGPGQSTSAGGCEQIDAVGFCGACNDAQCNPPQGTPTTSQPAKLICPDKNAYRDVSPDQSSFNINPVNNLYPNSNVSRGQFILYALNYKNTGTGVAKNGIFTDVLPSQVEYINSDSGCSYNSTNKTLTCNLGDIVSGQESQKAVRVKILDSAPIGSFTNSASINYQGGVPSNCQIPLNISAPGFSPTCPENISCATGYHACTGPDGCPSCCPDGFTPSCPENIMCDEGSYACTGDDGCPSCCAIACECVIIKVYDTSWRQYPASALSGIKPGDTVIFTVQGQTAQGTIDKARFRVNGGNYQETTSKKAGTQEYYYRYIIPNDATKVSIEAQVHLVETESWY